MSEIVRHPAYQEIVGMGDAVVPLILRDMEREPRYWGSALRALTGARPVPSEHAGKVQRVAEAWIRWGRERGYVW